MFWENIRCTIEGLDKTYKREYAKFDEFSDVEGLCELKNMIVGLRDSNILIEFDKIAHYVIDDCNFETDTYKPSKISNKFFVTANKILSSSFIPIYFPSIHGFVSFDAVEGLLMLVEFNYFYYSNMKCSRIKTFEKVFGGNIIQYLSFFTDDFKSMKELPYYDESFFEKLKKVDFEDKKSRYLEDFLRCGYLSSVTVEQNITWQFYNHIKFSSRYLMACNALKRESLKINCEDIVVGYTLTLRLITDDVRAYVREAFYKNK